MPPRGFKPPRYTETYYCIFDRRTGEILATETRWIDEGAEFSEPGVARELLQAIAEDAGRKVNDLDVLQTERPAQSLPMRVDVAKRRLVAVRTPKKAIAVPLPIAKP